jgi:predicted ATP-binding protein involved in virulence
MKLDKLILKNYRCFADFDLQFHPNLTVLVAPNGQGKTSILDAIKVALWPYVSGFDLGSTTNDTTSIQVDDVRRENSKVHEMEWRLPSEINLKGTITGTIDTLISDNQALQSLEWQSSRYRESIRKGTKTKERITNQYLNIGLVAKDFEKTIFSDSTAKDIDLPMLAYYGTGRLWAQKKLTVTHEKTSNEVQSRTFAYRDCLDPVSSYKHFAQWFTQIHTAYLQEQVKKLEKKLPFNNNLNDEFFAPYKVVQEAVDVVLKKRTGWHTLEFSHDAQELVLQSDQQGKLKVSQLSDGIRNILAMVGDIAYRCYKLNAHLGVKAAQLAQGVIMIDEIDMHLHPAWQQTVLIDLISAFPRLQFIVTTHSPQVLTSVDVSCIRLLLQHNDIESGLLKTEVQLINVQTLGVSSADILAQIMNVDPIPDVEQARWLSEFRGLIDQGLHDSHEGKQLNVKLISHFGKTHPVMSECDRMIRLQALKQKIAFSISK